MSLLLHGSLILIGVWLIIGGLGIPVPEDIALLATGILIHRGVVSWEVALAVVFVSVLVGDTLLFFLARRLGPKAFERKTFQRLLPPERRERIAAAYARYGGRMVFLARQVAGLRGAAFAMAGINRMAPRRFLFWDALAACVSVPLMIVLGYLGSQHVDRVRAGIDRVEHWLLLVFAVAVVGFVMWRHRHELLSGRTATGAPRTPHAHPHRPH